jgi:hypothetical protein
MRQSLCERAAKEITGGGLEDAAQRVVYKAD